MSARVALPQSLSGSATLTRSGEGVTFGSRSATVPPSQTAARTLSPQTTATMAPRTATVVSQGSAPVVTTSQPQEWGYNIPVYTIFFLLVIFVAVWLILAASKMNFVTDLVNGERVLNNGKVLLWTVVIGIILSVLLLVIMSSIKNRQ